MKSCPYCAEEIQDAAIKCRHCGSMLNAPPPTTTPTPAQPKSGRDLIGQAMRDRRVDALLGVSVSDVPSVVQTELERLAPDQQEAFIRVFKQKAKTTNGATAFWLFFCHYFYFGSGVGLLFLFTFGGMGVWWLLDAFRLKKMVQDYNAKVAAEILRGLRAGAT